MSIVPRTYCNELLTRQPLSSKRPIHRRGSPAWKRVEGVAEETHPQFFSSTGSIEEVRVNEEACDMLPWCYDRRLNRSTKYYLNYCKLGKNLDDRSELPSSWKEEGKCECWRKRPRAWKGHYIYHTPTYQPRQLLHDGRPTPRNASLPHLSENPRPDSNSTVAQGSFAYVRGKKKSPSFMVCMR